MKKIVFILAAFVCSVAAYSQNRIGIAGGVSLANMDGNIEGSIKGGVYVGLVLDKPISTNFTFHPTLSYVQKGTSQENPTLILKKRNYGLRYIEFTPNFLYNIHGDHGSFFLGAGPSIAFDLPSKKVEISTDKSVPDNTTIIHFGKTANYDMKGFDYGVNFATGYRLSGGFFLSANYNMSLRNLAVEGQSGHIKNHYFGIQLGYFFENGNSK